MRIAILKETAERERRVALVPDAVKTLVAAGHEVVVEQGAGAQAFLPDVQYVARGATVARGTLSTDTLRFPITLQGLSASGAAGRVDVNGQVFGLGNTNQILGTYRQVGATAAGVQTDLTGGLQLGNENLVVIRVFPAREGQVLTVAPDGVSVTLQR